MHQQLEVFVHFSKWSISDLMSPLLLPFAACSGIKSLTERTKAWVAPSYQTTDLGTALKKQFDLIETAVTAISADTTKLMARSKDANLPWTAAHTKQLTDAAKLASLNLARASMAAAMKQASNMRLSNTLGREQAAQQLQQRRLTVLGQSVRFVIVVYRFVGGIDGATQQVFSTFAAKWGQVSEGTIELQPANPSAPQ